MPPRYGYKNIRLDENGTPLPVEEQHEGLFVCLPWLSRSYLNGKRCHGAVYPGIHSAWGPSWPAVRPAGA